MKFDRWPARARRAAVHLRRSVAACGDDDDNGSSSDTTTTAASGAIQQERGQRGKTITVGSKNFTEQYILGEIYAQALEGRRLQGQEGAQPRLGADRATRRVKSGQVDAYPEYTGTALTSFFKVKSTTCRRTRSRRTRRPRPSSPRRS